MSQKLLSFDIGGTQIKYGIVSDSGEVLLAHTVPTQAQEGAAALLDRLVALAQPVVAQNEVSGIAISTLGLVDAESGRILGAAEAVPDYVGLSPKLALEAAFGLPVTIENDVNCVALAEGWQGSAKGVKHYIALAIGTGIGGGIVIDGKLYQGARSAAGEWGYMRIADRCWENHASMRGLVTEAIRVSGRSDWDGRSVFAARDAGDEHMSKVVDEWLDLLATGIVNLIYVLNPQRVIVGGGISGRGERFLSELHAAISVRIEPGFREMSEVVLASAGNHAGMIGAARNWFLNKRLF
ncbi:ROK family protein [Jeongeupia naejangsanensis]|uniref:ROK family protein n=1 Tax=Jeongeupia naejangsanensis TaxID=613195 RepID=A0ABS2BG59_9NEIS|nr:ROK family protein [Jeongeupia naejangsanensis]MBM3114445.1 ROK family protein [Jeongeupia naejangsanensis]